MPAPTDDYREAVASSEGLKQGAIAEAERRFRAAVDALIAARPRASGTAEMERIADAERTAVTWLQVARDEAIHAAERAHYVRLAAAGEEHGIVNGATAAARRREGP